MLDRHVQRRDDLSRQLWGLISFTLWFERWGGAEQGPPVGRGIRGPPPLRVVEDLGTALEAFGLALVVVWVTTPVVGRMAWRMGAIDRPRERGLHVFPTPRLGGMAILIGVAASALLFLPSNAQTHGIVAGAVVIALVGAADDLLELSADVKLLGQILAAGARWPAA